jgi:ribonuclease P protein subunit RPR2
MNSRASCYGKANFVKCEYSLLNGVMCKWMDTTTKRIAMQRVQTLFRLARETLREDPSLAQRYVGMARKIAMSARVRLPTEYRRQVCRYCKSFILPGVNCRVRIKQRREPHVLVTCLNCGKQTRIPLKEKQKP